MKQRIQYCGSCGDNGCGGCGNDTRNQFIQDIKSTVPGPKGQGTQGDPGLDNIVIGSQIASGGSTLPPVPGNDVALGGDVIATLKADGFDLQANETVRTYQDESDLTATKWLVAQSYGWINYTRTFIPRFVKAGGTAGQVPVKIDGTDFNWSWQSLASVIKNPYKTTSSTSNTIGLGTKSFTVEAGLQYYPNMLGAASSGADTDNYVTGIVTAYNPSTGALVIDVQAIGGSGTFTDWNLNVGFTPFLPAQAGYSGYFLSTDGINPFWAIPPSTQVADLIPSMSTMGRPGSLLCEGSSYPVDTTVPNSPTNPYRNLYDRTGASNPASPFYALGGNGIKVPLMVDTSGSTPGATLKGVGKNPITPLMNTYTLNVLGGSGGEDSHTLLSTESGVPPHTHPIRNSASSGETTAAFNNGHTSPDAFVNFNSPAIDFDGIVANNTARDASVAHNNVQVSVATYFYIVY